MKHMNILLGAATTVAMLFATGSAQAQALTDGQVLQLVSTVNDSEINLSQVAISKTQNQTVKDFAATMVAQHEANNVKIAAVEVKTGITREETEASRDLKKRGDDATEALKSAKDADFDRAYIDGQVILHQEFLTALDSILIPAAKNADVLAHLQGTRADTEAHLNNAKQIQASLTPTPPTP